MSLGLDPTKADSLGDAVLAEELLAIAPHLVTLQPLLFPIYGIPFASKAFYDAGLTLYDLLGARHDGGWHRRLRRSRGTGDGAVLSAAPYRCC